MQRKKSHQDLDLSFVGQYRVSNSSSDNPDILKFHFPRSDIFFKFLFSEQIKTILKTSARIFNPFYLQGAITYTFLHLIVVFKAKN